MMGLTSTIVRAILAAAIISPVLAINENEFAPDDVIIRDVCILGGGATGTYAAVSLKDKAKSVVVVERHGILGGHTETLYTDNDQYVDYGVEGLFDNELSRNYFNRLGIDYKLLLPNTLVNQYVDFKTGKKVSPPAGLLDTAAAAVLYRTAIQKYSYLQDGLYNLPDPVPDELLRPFSEFVEEAGIQGALQFIFMFSHNLGNVLETPLLYVLQSIGIPHIDALLEGGYITPKAGMYQLYEKASEVLGSDVIYQSTVNETERSDSGVKIVVQSANGARKLIKANQLLVTFVPYKDNLQGFDLATTESSVFGKWDWKGYYVAVVNNTGIPNAVTVLNTDPSNNTPGNLPLPPFQWALQYLGADGYLASKIVGDKSLTEGQARELVLSDIRRMRTAGTYPGGDPEIVAFGSHVPETLTVSNAEIRGGFYKKLYALQGTKNTFYTGLAFCSDHSALLWAYTETVVQKMISS